MGSPEHEFFMSAYPASIADLDFAATVQALPAHQSDSPAPQQQHQLQLQLKAFDDGLLHQPLNLPQPQDSALLSPSALRDLKQPKAFFGASPRKNSRAGARQRPRPRVASAPSSTRSDSPACSPRRASTATARARA